MYACEGGERGGAKDRHYTIVRVGGEKPGIDAIQLCVWGKRGARDRYSDTCVACVYSSS